MAYKGTPQPLSDFRASYQEAGYDIAVFSSGAGDRFVLRLVDPDDPTVSGAYLASFSNGGESGKNRVVEADRPHPEVKPGEYDAENKDAAQKLNALVQGKNNFVVCTCVIDEESLAKSDRYTEDDLGNTFLVVAYSGRVASDAYADAPTTKTVQSDAGTRRQSNGRGRVRA